MHWLLLIFLGLLWGPSFLAIKIGLREIPPFTLAAGRVLIAGVLVYVLMRLGGNSWPKGGTFWRKFFIMGFLANALPFSLLMIGQTMAPSAIAAIVNGFTPVATAIIANFAIEEERLTGRTLTGVLTGLGGIILLFLPALFDTTQDGNLVLGMLAFVGTATGYGSSMVYSRRALRGYPRFVAPAAQLLCATILLVPVALVVEWDRLHVPGVESLVALIWLGVIATAVAYIVYYRLLEIAGATFLSLVTFLLPPLGAAIGVIFLDERLGWNAIVGCVLILLGVGFVRNVPGKKA